VGVAGNWPGFLSAEAASGGISERRESFF